MIRYIVVACILLSACRPSGSTQVMGASSPEAAVNAFMTAAKAQDLQAMSEVWGSARGSVRETMERTEMERRQLVLISLLCQEGSSLAGSTPGTDGRRMLRVEMTRSGRTVPVVFTTVRGPGDRWFVEDVEVLRLQELCAGR